MYEDCPTWPRDFYNAAPEDILDIGQFEGIGDILMGRDYYLMAKQCRGVYTHVVFQKLKELQ